MFCQNCGHQNEENAKFCDNCGVLITGSSMPESQQPQGGFPPFVQDISQQQYVSPPTQNMTTQVQTQTMAIPTKSRNIIIMVAAVVLIIVGMLFVGSKLFGGSPSERLYGIWEGDGDVLEFYEDGTFVSDGTYAEYTVMSKDKIKINWGVFRGADVLEFKISGRNRLKIIDESGNVGKFKRTKSFR